MTHHLPRIFRTAPLGRLFAVLAFVQTLLAVPAWADDTAFYRLQAIGPGTYVAVIDPGQRGGANVGIVIGSEAVAVIDSFMNPRAAEALLADIRKLTALPVRYVINTHYHLDHVAGNPVFRDAGAIIIAHPNLTLWQHSENPRLLGRRLSPERQKLIDALPTPSIEVADSLQLNLGGRALTVRSYPGHSGSDLAVFAADAHTVFCGDLFWNHMLPNLIDANVEQQQVTLDRWLGTSDIRTFVPGHGPVGNARDVEDFKDYLGALRDAVATRVAAHADDATIETEVARALKQHYGDWKSFDYFIATDVRYMLAELRGDKHQPGTPSASR